MLLLAVFLTFATRFYNLGIVPAGLYLDEAAQLVLLVLPDLLLFFQKKPFVNSLP